MALNDRLARVLKLAELLAKSQRGIVLSKVADEHDWSLRALYRDIKTIEAAGWPLTNEGPRYRLVDGWKSLLQSGIDTDELLGLFAARQVGWGGTSVGSALERLWNKLVSTSGRSSTLVPMESPWFTVRSPFGIDYDAHRKTIATLERALKEKQVVSTRYAALSTGELTARAIEPGVLHWDPKLETLYCIAWCQLRREVRVFAVHRFRMVSLTRDKFAPRPDVGPGVLRQAFRVWSAKNIEKVTIEFQNEAAREIAERRWHPSQTLESLSDERVRLHLEVAGLEEIERFVLGYGGDARVLAPVRLIDSVRRRLDEARAHYANEPARSEQQRTIS